MIRALILAAIVALVVSVAPIASAGTAKKPPSPNFIEIGTSETLDLERECPEACPTVSSRGWTRTNNPPVNSRMLCQLSYAGRQRRL